MAAVDIKEIGIVDLRVKKAVNRDFFFEIPRLDGSAKADILVFRVSPVFAKKERIRFSCFIKYAEIRVRGAMVPVTVSLSLAVG